MEALAKLGIDFKVLFAQLLNFGILLFILSKLLYRPMLDTLQKRKERIAESLKKAEGIEKKSKATEEEYDKRIIAANKEAVKIIEEAKQAAEKVRSKILAEAETEAAALKASAREQIETERESLYAQVRQSVGKLALFVITKVLMLDQGEEFYKRNIDKALQELE